MITKKKSVTEAELAAPLVTWLQEQHWTIYQEVQFRHHGGVADIVAVRNGILWIIETKTSYTFRVLEQASSWPVHFRSVAVPRAMTRDRDYRVAKFYYQVGVIEIESDYFIREVQKPPVFNRNKYEINKYLKQLTPLHQTFAVAGSKGGHHLTPYKETIMEVRKCVEVNPGCTIKFLYETLGSMHYANERSFKGSLLSALATFENAWCRIDYSQKAARLYIRDDKKMIKQTRMVINPATPT